MEDEKERRNGNEEKKRVGRVMNVEISTKRRKKNRGRDRIEAVFMLADVREGGQARV